MSGTHRVYHRRKNKSSAARLGLAAALAGALAAGAIAVGVIVLRPGVTGGARPGPDTAGQGSAGVPAGTAPPAGWPLDVTTPDGYRYTMAAISAGTRERPWTGAPSPSGAVYAYADYVLRNDQKQPILLDFPADLFVRRALVPESARSRCMPQPGVPDDMCTLPNQAQIVLRLRNSPAPVVEGADTFIPPGASYLVRVVTDLPVKKGAGQEDMRLYVWNVRFTADRKAIEIGFP